MSRKNAVQNRFHTAADVIFQTGRYVSRCGPRSTPTLHPRCGRSAANPGGCDTHGVRSNSRSVHDPCAFQEASPPIARAAITFSSSSIFRPRFIASLKSFLNCVVGLTVYFVFLMLSGLQRVHPDRCTLSRTDLWQSFLPPAWR